VKGIDVECHCIKWNINHLGGHILVNVKLEQREIQNFSQLEKSVTYEVASFCVSWKRELDLLLFNDVWLTIFRKHYGYDIQYQLQNEYVKWFFQLELYYPNLGFEQRITYLKISRFITMPTKRGNGQEVFRRLLQCCSPLKALDMIRLRSVRNAVGFWEKQNFRESYKAISWLEGDPLEYDLGCLKRPSSLTKCQFIYDIRKCNCPWCCQYRQ